ncbi:F-box/LRR-repeat protein 4-like [Haliotis rubra]|uniref:F-box/LRR-repeat protein 4-like n=1 Tax=Haliotis rubra TaxID=36100 RepID=UPI001EE5ECFF|nr:F-box/LRR-repeat protein 4-like [Haliotis rubra]
MASKQDDPLKHLQDLNVIQHYAKDVVDFSSQYGSETSISYTACNLSGKSNIYPGYGDFTQACVFRTYGPWWRQAPSACRVYKKTRRAYCSMDFIELSFEQKVYPIRLDVYETYHPGAVVKIMACDTTAGTDVDTGKVTWVTLWSDTPTQIEMRPRVFSPPLNTVNFATDLIRLELCHEKLQYYTELDAVIILIRLELCHEKLQYYTELDAVIILIRLELCHEKLQYYTELDATSVFLLNRVISVYCSLIRLELCHEKLQYYTELDAVILQGISDKDQYQAWAATNKILTQSLERLELRDTHVTETTNESWKPVLNGYFGCLPEEVIQLILSYLDTPSICCASQTCKLLRQHCYDPLLYTEVNLQPHWPQVSDEVLDSLQCRCYMIQRLNLSWCGKNGPISTIALTRFLGVCGQTLSSLGLSCCQFVTGEYLSLIAENCPQLTVPVSKKITFCMMELTKITKLQKLNLYRTFVELTPLLNIIYSCPDLQHLNIGSCSRISSHDDVAAALGKFSKKLRSLDLWRSRKISYIGLQAIANNCFELEELDIGWCTDLHSSTGCLVSLVEKCKKLRKLFLTANRTVCDVDLLAIAKNLANLEQLDILGTREVTADAAVRVLENCKKLRFFDVSFCAGLDNVVVEGWRKVYPNIAIKKSFQS